MTGQSTSQRVFRRPRLLAGLAVAAAVGITLTGCTASAEDDQKVITIFGEQGGQMDLNTNSFTRLLEEKFDVDIDFQTTGYDSGAATEARQVSLAGGELPEAYMLVPWASQFTQAELQRYGDQGVILPLNDLIDEHAPNIADALASEPGFETLATAPDGKIWGLPQWNDCYHCSYPYKFWINTQWLETLGLQMPTTTDEFFDVMMAFKTGDPNGNGVVDEIPITGSAQWSIVPFIMNAFISNSFNTGAGANNQPISLGLDGDTVQMQTMQDGWREGLKFLNKMWAAGLIDPASFSQGGDTMQATGNSAQAVLVGGFTAIHPGIGVSIGQEDGRDNQYNPVPPLDGAAGPITTYQLPSVPGATFVITKAADETEQKIIMEMMDYIFSPEGHLRGQQGEENIGWRAPEPGDVALDPDLEPSFFDLPLDEENEADYNGNWGPMAQVFDTTEWRNSQVQPLDIYTQEGFERRLFEATDLYDGKESDAMFPYWNLWIPAEEASELSTLTTNVESNVATATAEFVTGVRDPNSDADWDAYLQGLDGLGVTRYVEIWQTAFDAN
ncbi:extracellular solute-binding protein [Microbacterium trichothecenolyticum]|uniref:extracellular solute-binding protein n=1 Tax=Microbacterium trichothecenolyticum TaxID=69370 RepID=UPI001C6EC1C1|nr:extracellular solute-binding protein [Microbacterium trichothecenolyticum]MBW9121108.1 extracellular solute-binding protein [Microbacterium trichothecenolyticum]